MSSTALHRATFLDSFRAITIVMVVAIHARAEVELPSSFESIFYFLIATIAVPSFFLCDGYLFVLRGASRMRSAGYAEYLRRSAKRLLIPWLVFSLAYTAVRAVFEALGVLDQHVVVGRSIWQITTEIYSSGIAPQMYFLASLFLIRVGSFAFRRLCKVHVLVAWGCFFGYGVLYRCLLAEPLQHFFSTGIDPVLHAMWGLQFYLLGIALARAESLDSRRALPLAIATWAILAVLFSVGGRQAWPAAVQYAYLLAAFLTFFVWGDRGRFLAAFGRDSMGVYLLHAPIILNVVGLVFSTVVQNPVALYVWICTGTTGLSWLGARILKLNAAGRWALGMPSSS